MIDGSTVQCASILKTVLGLPSLIMIKKNNTSVYLLSDLGDIVLYQDQLGLLLPF